MKVLHIASASSPDSRHIATAVEALRRGAVIIYPTDTLYAFGCDALNARAVEALCRIKGINPEKNTLSIVCCDISQASEYARIDNRAFRILKDSLPGPYTYILPAATSLPKPFRGRRCVGVRVPDCNISRELARELGNPLMTSSVLPPAEDPELVADASALALAYGHERGIELTLVGGDGSLRPSTVIDLVDRSAPVVVRE